MYLAYRTNIKNEIDLHVVIHKMAIEFEKISKNIVKLAMLKTATSELGHNILKYAKKGTIYIYVLTEGQKGIKVVASDQGPGIKDLDLALTDNFSSSGTLGLGLPGVKRMADEFSLSSEIDEGTTVTITFYL